MVKILIIDDDSSMNRALAGIAGHLGFLAYCATTLKQGLRLTRQADIDLILLDVRLPDGNGIEAMASFLDLPSKPEIIVITKDADITSAKKALKNGAWDYIHKPFSNENLILVMTRAIEYRNQKTRSNIQSTFNRKGIVGSSNCILKALEQTSHAALCKTNVLITGETGTGKELFARAVHRNSPQRHKNLVVVDCAAITEHLAESMLFGHDKGSFTGADKSRQGLVRNADGGTLFLDEIGELPLGIQKKFLRFLQEHEFRPVGSDMVIKSSFRLISATNRDLENMVEQGSFRQDLLFRLRGIDIKVPSLKDRKEDIKEIIGDHTNRYCDKQQMKRKIFSPCFLEALVQYDWPGNIRELLIVMEKVLATACHDSTLYAFHLPSAVRLARTIHALNSMDKSPCSKGLPTFRASQQLSAKIYLKDLLSAAKGDKNKACTLSGLSKSYLYKLLNEHKIGFKPEKIFRE